MEIFCTLLPLCEGNAPVNSMESATQTCLRVYLRWPFMIFRASPHHPASYSYPSTWYSRPFIVSYLTVGLHQAESCLQMSCEDFTKEEASSAVTVMITRVTCHSGPCYLKNCLHKVAHLVNPSLIARSMLARAWCRWNSTRLCNSINLWVMYAR